MNVRLPLRLQPVWSVLVIFRFFYRSRPILRLSLWYRSDVIVINLVTRIGMLFKNPFALLLPHRCRVCSRRWFCAGEIQGKCQFTSCQWCLSDQKSPTTTQSLLLCVFVDDGDVFAWQTRGCEVPNSPTGQQSPIWGRFTTKQKSHTLGMASGIPLQWLW